MTARFNFARGSRIPLTQSEIDILQAFVSNGDRGGFYLAYYAMTGAVE